MSEAVKTTFDDPTATLIREPKVLFDDQPRAFMSAISPSAPLKREMARRPLPSCFG